MVDLRRDMLAPVLAALSVVMIGAGDAGASGVQLKPVLPPLSERVQTHEALRLLAELGYEPGAVDGAMTTNIAGAIRIFQQTHNLPVDGKVTDGLVATLRTAKQ